MDKEGRCKIRINNPNVVISCEELRENIDFFKKSFREKNKTDLIIKMTGKDSGYDRYCAELDSFLATCKCKQISSDMS